jgi:Na+/H+ antiporter NhaD/arsenite permease-like protein
VLDNAPTYLAFLKAVSGAFVDEASVKAVQALLASGGSDLSAAAEPVRLSYQTLVSFFGSAASAKSATPEQIQIACLLGNEQLNKYIVAVSVGAVFFGANTYIGNGPNFMVKSIADHQKVHTPGFLGYIVRFTLPVMLPMLVLTWLLFFRK